MFTGYMYWKCNYTGHYLNHFINYYFNLGYRGHYHTNAYITKMLLECEVALQIDMLFSFSASGKILVVFENTIIKEPCLVEEIRLDDSDQQITLNQLLINTEKVCTSHLLIWWMLMQSYICQIITIPPKEFT